MCNHPTLPDALGHDTDVSIRVRGADEGGVDIGGPLEKGAVESGEYDGGKVDVEYSRAAFWAL